MRGIMSETRDRQVVVNIEGTFFDLVELVSQKDNITRSSYIRGAIIKDLLSRGMLSERTLAQILL